MNEKIFNQMLDDIGAICLAQGEQFENVIISITLINSKIIKALCNNIDICGGYVRIWDDCNECYHCIPYASILCLEC